MFAIATQLTWIRCPHPCSHFDKRHNSKHSTQLSETKRPLEEISYSIRIESLDYLWRKVWTICPWCHWRWKPPLWVDFSIKVLSQKWGELASSRNTSNICKKQSKEELISQYYRAQPMMGLVLKARYVASPFFARERYRLFHFWSS